MTHASCKCQTLYRIGGACRVPQQHIFELTAQEGSGRVLHGALLPTHSSPAHTPLSVPNLPVLSALQIPRPTPANLLQPKQLTRRWTWQACSQHPVTSCTLTFHH